MKRLFFGTLLATAMVIPAFAALKQGDTAPDFSAKASLAGKEFDFSLEDGTEEGAGRRVLLSVRVHGRLQHRSAHVRGEQGEVRCRGRDDHRRLARQHREAE